MDKINSLKNNIPLPIRLFLGKALLFFIIWKIVYSFLSIDSQSLNNILTSHIGEASTYILNNTGVMSGFSSEIQKYTEVYDGQIINNQVSAIYHRDKKVLHIANVCNGLELIVLYIGFIVCMPSSIFRKIKYIIIGAIILDLTNIFRCVGLIYLREYYEAYFQFAHHYLFKMMVYMTTFAIWMFYCRKIQIKNDSI